MFKRSQHVGQCCFYGNTEGSLGLIFTPKLFGKLRCCHVRPPLWRWMNTDGKMRKCIPIAIFLYHLEITPSHINKNRELKQREQERHWERCKTIDLITEYNHFMWECNHLVHWSPENKRNVDICWAKRLTGSYWFQNGRNICQHHATYPNKVYRRTQHVVPNMLAQHVAFVCTGLWNDFG